MTKEEINTQYHKDVTQAEENYDASVKENTRISVGILNSISNIRRHALAIAKLDRASALHKLAEEEDLCLTQKEI